MLNRKTLAIRTTWFAVFLFWCFSLHPALAQEGPDHHAQSDAYWADLAKSYPAFVVDQSKLRVAAESVAYTLGATNSGIAATDSRGGTGYIMYSIESVHNRFSSNPPHAESADHLIAVVYENGQWMYDNNSALYAFTPLVTDRLVAEVDFSNDTATLLVGQSTLVNGINAGYVSGDLVITPNVWTSSPSAADGEFGVEGTSITAGSELSSIGEWGPVLDWPHIPVSAAHLPDGRILTWASNDEEGFPGGQPEFTYAAAWNPADESFKMVPHNSHDMFCAHQVMLEDGDVLVMGGRNTVKLVSKYDYETDTWIPQEQMGDSRWYPTSLALPNGEVMVAIGSGGSNNPEMWNELSGWRKLTGVDLNGPILNYTGYYENNWWPLLHVAPNGQVFHSGPTPDMHYIDTEGNGSITKVGPQITDWYPKHGTTIMYEEGKILTAGGAIAGGNTASSNRSMVIDLTSGTPVVREIASMAHARKFQNGVPLPTGEVLVIGGNTSGIKFNDSGTVLTPEIFDPVTETWTEVADMAKPRNYHSVALLMTDGRVWTGGGGLCGVGCAANHIDAQIYSPPYLFNADGTPATRPEITSSPEVVRNGANITVSATAGITRFSAIKMSSTTHGVDSDVRQLALSFSELTAGTYDVTIHENENVMTPGYWMLFAVNADGVPSEAAVIQVSTEGIPDIGNPGTQVTPEGTEYSMQIEATDSDGGTLSFTAIGLPAGLSINGGTGVISGTPADGSTGTYEVTVSVTDGESTVDTQFLWVVTTGATGQILREWWTGIGGTAITTLTDNANYPDNPTGTDFLDRFEAPADWAENYGTRIRGYIHAPATGDYTFWISTDDNGELWLSSDSNPANKTMIANVPGWSADYEWTKYPEQQSASISLVAGERYYVEVLQKEGGGGDNIAVAWQIPGGSLEVIEGGFLSPYTGAPEVEPPAEITTAASSTVAFGLEVNDPEDDALTYAAINLPSGMSIDTNTGTISGTLAEDSDGSYDVEVTISDNANVTTANFTWTVLDPTVVHTGVIFEYFKGDWDLLPDFDTLVARNIGVTNNFGVTPRDQNDFFGFRHRGYINIETAGDYTFYTTSDDGSQLFINGTMIVDNDGLHGAAEKSGVVTLDVGYHPIEVTVFEKGGAESLVVHYEGPGITKQTIPDEKLSVYALPNQAPAITAVLDQSGAEGEAVSLQVSATDPEGDALTFSAEGLPNGLSISNSGLISGGLVAGSSGTAMVTINVTDGVLTSSMTFAWNIDPARGSWIDYTDDSAVAITLTSVPSDDGEEKDIAVGDLNKDGWDDIIVVRKGPFMDTDARADLLLMNEAGTLVDRTDDLAPGFAIEPTIARDAIITDLDGDGWDDVLIANTFGDQPKYYRNLGADASGWLGLVDESATRLPVLDISTIQYCGVAAGDVNGDGAPDLYFSNYVMDGTTKDVLLINDGNGNFTDEGDDRLGDLINVAFGTQGSITDMDGDGDNDIVKLSANQAADPFPTDGIFVLYNDGTGNFSNWSTVPSNDAYMFIMEDFDNNGEKDFYIVDDAADYVNLSNGITQNANINFTQTTTPWARTSSNGANLRVGDLDRDGDLDIGVADVDTSFPPCETPDNLRAFLLLENEGSHSGTFIDPFGAADKPWSKNMYDFAFIDVNNDGNLDIFSAECSGYGLFTSTQDPVEEPQDLVALPLGNLGLGIAAHDPRTGDGYIMYSEESVHTRFDATPPSAWGADHLIAVVFDGGEWKIDRNKNTLVPFSIRSSDRLLVEVDFGENTVSSLEGQNTIINGISAGYESGDLVITPETWGGNPDNGEFWAEGTEVVIDAMGLNSSPVIAAIDDQSNYIEESVSLTLSASDSDGDAVVFTVTGLPGGLSLSGNTISGTLSEAGIFSVGVTATDGNGGVDNTSFAWTVDGGDPTATINIALGDLRNGIAAHDQRTGNGYIMYSEESVHTRFADNPPSAWQADHLIAVVFDGGEWKVDRNKYTLVPFTPLASDHLVASVDFGADVVTHLVGVNTAVEGINAGYVSGDLVITAEMWAGSPNEGEFGLEGTTLEIPGEVQQAIARGDDPAILTGPDEALPEAYDLSTIYPNPFSGTTTIEYQLPEESAVRIEIFNITGQRVKVLIDNNNMPAGSWSSIWDGTDESDKAVAAGVYIVRLQADGYNETSKVVMVK